MVTVFGSCFLSFSPHVNHRNYLCMKTWLGKYSLSVVFRPIFSWKTSLSETNSVRWFPKVIMGKQKLFWLWLEILDHRNFVCTHTLRTSQDWFASVGFIVCAWSTNPDLLLMIGLSHLMSWHLMKWSSRSELILEKYFCEMNAGGSHWRH